MSVARTAATRGRWRLTMAIRNVTILTMAILTLAILTRVPQRREVDGAALMAREARWLREAGLEPLLVHPPATIRGVGCNHT